MADAEENHRNIQWDKVAAIAGVVAVIAAIVIPLYIYLQQRESKELTYSIVSQTSLLEVTNAAYRDKIQVLYNGNEVEELTLYVIEINNSGTEPISIPAEFTDLERPINISFGEGARVLGANPSGFSPQNLRVSLRLENNAVAVNPVLLNPDSKFTFEVLVEGNSSPTVDWWLNGVKKVKEVSDQNTSILYLIIILLLIILVISISVWSTLTYRKSKKLMEATIVEIENARKQHKKYLEEASATLHKRD